METTLHIFSENCLNTCRICVKIVYTLENINARNGTKIVQYIRIIDCNKFIPEIFHATLNIHFD